MRPVEVRRVSFDHHKAYRRPAEVRIVYFDQCKACMRPVELRRIHFDQCKACRRPVGVPRVRFDHRKACRRPVEFWRVRFYHRKACKMPIDLIRTIILWLRHSLIPDGKRSRSRKEGLDAVQLLVACDGEKVRRVQQWVRYVKKLQLIDLATCPYKLSSEAWIDDVTWHCCLPAANSWKVHSGETKGLQESGSLQLLCERLGWYMLLP